MNRVILSPSKYIQGPGEIRNLQKYFSSVGMKGVYAIASPSTLEKYQADIESSFKEAGTPIKLEKFNRECSKNEIDRIIADLEGRDVDVIMGIGGGKTLDTAKAVAYYRNLPVIIVPTIASTDAPCSALSVLYHDDGAFDQYLFLKANPNAVVLDTNIVAKAPARLLVSGMGDALATYFEARACKTSGATSIAGGTCSLTAMAIAELCLDTLLADGLKAKLSLEGGVCSQAVQNVIEANTYLSGIGFESGGLAAAHAVHNGLTVLEQTHHYYHGEKVAFGTLTQLCMENAELEEIEEIVDFCKSVGLPTTLKQLGIDPKDEAGIRKAAEAASVEGETIHNMPFKVTAEDVYSAMILADKLGQ